MAHRRPGLDEQPLRLEGLEVDLAAERPMGTSHEFGGGSGRSALWLGAGVAGLLAIVIGTSMLLGDEPPMPTAHPALSSGLARQVAAGLGNFTTRRLNAQLEGMPKAPLIAARRSPPEVPPASAAPAPAPVPADQPAPPQAEPEPEPDADPPANDGKPFSQLPTIADDDAEPTNEPEPEPVEDAEDADPPAADAPVENDPTDDARPV